MNEFLLIGAAAVFIAVIFWLKKPKEKAVRGDELAIWPFEPMLIMTDSEVQFFKKLLNLF